MERLQEPDWMSRRTAEAQGRTGPASDQGTSPATVGPTCPDTELSGKCRPRRGKWTGRKLERWLIYSVWNRINFAHREVWPLP